MCVYIYIYIYIYIFINIIVQHSKLNTVTWHQNSKIPGNK